MYLLRHSRNNMVRMYEFTEKENRNNFVVYYSSPFWSHKIASYIKKKKTSNPIGRLEKQRIFPCILFLLCHTCNIQCQVILFPQTHPSQDVSTASFIIIRILTSQQRKQGALHSHWHFILTVLRADITTLSWRQRAFLLAPLVTWPSAPFSSLTFSTIPW